ncbi:MAG: YjbH domain-containing protein, partial [Sedimentitalea sp.]|nr:YjbH domain-containing protein [Sedimentitalea sp.]
WLSASFRYSGIQNLNLYGYEDFYDRSFDVRLRLLKERPRFPEITLGLQDFAGTGVFSSEYLVATKTFQTPAFGSLTAPGNLKLTAGLGWGRMGSSGSIGSTGT